jgi:Peptidase S24-like.
MPEVNEETKIVKAAELFGLTDEILAQGGRVWVTVTGNSMYPFLKEVRDSVELSKASFENIKKGDIVLIRRISGAYVLHRVLKKEDNCFYIIGDAQQWIEGPLKPEQLHAIVTRIKRKGQVFANNYPLLKLCVSIWLFVIPFRYRILRIMRFLKRFVVRFLPD